jgi:hypothetical protein
MVRKRHTKKEIRPVKAKAKSRKASVSRPKSLRKPLDVQQHVFRVFAAQADSLWDGLTDQCRQFAHGFNQAIGAPALQVLAEPTTLRVAYPQADAELFFQFDRGERFLQAWMNTGCATYGTCLTDLLPVGLTVRGKVLRFALKGDVASDEQLAVTLLTQLTSGSSA